MFMRLGYLCSTSRVTGQIQASVTSYGQPNQSTSGLCHQES